MTAQLLKLEKTIARQKERIAAGDYYEAHQQLRTISARYSKVQDWESAIAVLYNGALALLLAGQGGSGGDLSCTLVEALHKSKRSVDSETKGRLTSLLRAFSEEEPTRRKFVTEIIRWTADASDYPYGDPELHHVIGSLYASEANAYEAERHLALGTKESPIVLAQVEYDWYSQDDSHTAGTYCARCVFPYLLTSNLKSANTAYSTFTSCLTSGNKSLTVQEVSNNSSDVRIYPSLPLLNFIGLLLLAVQRGSADLYRQLAKHYAAYLEEVNNWNDALTVVGELYFGIRKPSPNNPLFDMMGSMMGLGSGGSARPKRVEAHALPPSEGLD